MYLVEVLGQREAQPLQGVGRRLDRMWYYLLGGPVGPWLEQHGISSDLQRQAVLYALLGFMGLGAAATAFVEISFASLYAGTVVFLALSGGLLALAAHRSGRYAATRKAASLVEEWQLHTIRGISAGKTLDPAGEGRSYVDLQVRLRASITDDQKRRLTRSFRRFFGRAAFQTVLGRALDDVARNPPGDTVYDKIKRSVPDRPVDREFKLAYMSLLLYGYASEEIDRMLDDGAIARPQAWTRYYVTPPAPPPAVVSTIG